MNKEEQLTTGLRNLVHKMTRLNKPQMEACFREYLPSEVHCSEYIGRNEGLNVTKLADAFCMSIGAMSKITTKLVEKGIIESYQKPENRKEIYFQITEQGKRLNERHEELHKEFQLRDKAVFEQITPEEFDSMQRFVEKYCEHLDAEIKKL